MVTISFLSGCSLTNPHHIVSKLTMALSNDLTDVTEMMLPMGLTIPESHPKNGEWEVL